MTAFMFRENYIITVEEASVIDWNELYDILTNIQAEYDDFVEEIMPHLEAGKCPETIDRTHFEELMEVYKEGLFDDDEYNPKVMGIVFRDEKYAQEFIEWLVETTDSLSVHTTLYGWSVLVDNLGAEIESLHRKCLEELYRAGIIVDVEDAAEAWASEYSEIDFNVSTIHRTFFYQQ